MAPTRDTTNGRSWPTPPRLPDVTASGTSVRDLDAAFQRALVTYGLLERAELREALRGGHVATVTPVRSLTAKMPDYLLATVVGRSGLRVVAMFILGPTGPTFAGMTTAHQPLPRYPLVLPQDASVNAVAAGFRPIGQPRLVWAWSTESSSPYYPFYELTVSAGTIYVDMHGRVLSAIHLQ